MKDSRHRCSNDRHDLLFGNTTSATELSGSMGAADLTPVTPQLLGPTGDPISSKPSLSFGFCQGVES